MNRRRRSRNSRAAFLPVIVSIVLLTDVPAVQAVTPLTVKAALGGQSLSQPAGMTQGDLPPSDASHLAWQSSLSLLLERHRVAVGVAVETEFFYDVSVGPEFGVGPQTFSIQPVQALIVAEWRFDPSPGRRLAETQPYARLAAGWNFNPTTAKLEWPQFAPDGAVTALEADGSPAVKIATGLYQRVSRRSLYLVGEIGWGWNAGDYRMAVSNRPDREGSYDLSGFYLVAGVALTFGERD